MANPKNPTMAEESASWRSAHAATKAQRKAKGPKGGEAVCVHCGDPIGKHDTTHEWVDVNGLTSCESAPRDPKAPERFGTHAGNARGRVYRCPLCGSLEVEYEGWVGVNDGCVSDSSGAAYRCSRCESEIAALELCDVDGAGLCHEHRRPHAECREQSADQCCEGCAAEEPDPTEHAEWCIYAERLGDAGRVAP